MLHGTNVGQTHNSGPANGGKGVNSDMDTDITEGKRCEYTQQENGKPRNAQDSGEGVQAHTRSQEGQERVPTKATEESMVLPTPESKTSRPKTERQQVSMVRSHPVPVHC